MKHRKKWRPHRRSRLHKKLRRGNNRQVLKEELRTVMLGEEDFDVYGDNGIGSARPQGNRRRPGSARGDTWRKYPQRRILSGIPGIPQGRSVPVSTFEKHLRPSQLVSHPGPRP